MLPTSRLPAALGTVCVLTSLFVGTAAAASRAPGAAKAPGAATPGYTKAGPLVGAPSVACASLPSLAVGHAEQASVTLGSVRAELAGIASKAKYGGIAAIAHVSLEIWEAGKVVYRQPVAVPSSDLNGKGNTFVPQSVTASSTKLEPLCLATFSGADPEDAAVVGMYSGGAHCCSWADIYAMPGGKVSAPIEHDFGDPGVSVTTNAGRSILDTADDAFAYEFDSFAFSGLPVLVYEVQGHALVNTTKDHVAMVKANASMYWTAYQDAQNPKEGEGKGGGLGVLAAWVADECTLGHGQTALSTVKKLEAKGALSGGANDKDGTWPTGAKYVSTLESFLVKHNYSC